MKTHAKDYLNEFKASQSLWLKNLIDEAINTNGNISEVKINGIYKLLKDEVAENEATNTTQATNSTDKLTLKKLIHNSGINALKNQESISFSENCNVLFGLNGSGKSSYFRILNEIVGGNEKKDILPNIYLDTAEPISVDIDYLLGASSNQLNWNNTSRAIFPFNVVRVFDSSYLNGLLNKREIDSTLVEPFGLNLFSYIIETIDRLKTKLSAEIQGVKDEKPKINSEKFSLQNKGLFEQNHLNITQEKEVKSKFEFVEEDSKKLDDFKKQHQNLSQQNIQDRIKLESTKYNEIDSIKKSIVETAKKINTFAEEAKNILESYEKFHIESNEFKKQIEVLKKLPSTDSDKWKSFIKSASTYSKEVKDSEEICIYCRQPLQSDALAIVKAYSKYLNNESETELEKVTTKINTLINNLEQISINLQMNQEIKQLFKTTAIESENISICRAMINFYKQCKKLKSDLLFFLSKKEKMVDFLPLSCQNLSSGVDILLADINLNIEKLKSDETTKQTELKKLLDAIVPIEEHKAIFEQKEQIQKWITLGKKIQVLEAKMNAINTRALSSLSKEAHDNLLTENLKTKFVEELQSIGFRNLDVKLENAGVSKGKTQTKLTLYNTDKISSILSEGEQKAVALSIFIAEVRMQAQTNPIIFDDPVNSLDHNIASNFAKRILELDNQIIVFTHNKLFLDSLETAKGNHICGNYNGGCSSKKGKHIYLYTVQSEGRSSKGIVFPRNEDKAKTHLLNAKQYLGESPFSKHNEVASKLRKTVECLIDEKVFNGQVPTKFTSKNNRIHWDSLKQLNNTQDLIGILREVHDRVSGGEMHNGTESEENQIGKEEFDNMVRQLDFIITGNSN
jgi:energy-coupling factor transporter ATP-binding protein EcfA2